MEPLISNENLEPENSPEGNSVWDELVEFYNELKDMIYEDFRNSYLFLSNNKNYVVVAVMLAFLLQFSSISNLGTSFDKYCSKAGKTEKAIQKGGANAPAAAPPSTAPSVELRTFQQVGKERADAQREAKQQAKKAKDAAAQKAAIDKEVKKQEKKGATPEEARQIAEGKAKQKLEEKQQARDDAAMSKGKRQVKLGFKESEKERRQQDQLMKANKERLSFFEGLKKKFGSQSLGTTLGGPMFGNMDLIFDSVKHIFYIIGIILTIAGIISLPVMIFLIITYTIMKAMVARFTVL